MYACLPIHNVEEPLCQGACGSNLRMFNCLHTFFVGGPSTSTEAASAAHNKQTNKASVHNYFFLDAMTTTLQQKHPNVLHILI